MTRSPADHPLIAREGRVHIGIAGLLALAASSWGGLGVGLLGCALFAFVVQFFRDPRRQIPQEPGVVVAPASGQVVAITPAPNPYLAGAEALKISIFMNVFNVHSNRIPAAGKVMRREYTPGRFLNARLDKTAEENERNMLHLRTSSGDDLFCVQIAGLIARRILCYVQPGDEVATGERYGFIRFGSRVDLYLPRTARVLVQLGQRVASGSDRLASLARSA